MSSAILHSPIHIIGAGSIGQLWAASIRAKVPSFPVILLLRDHHRKRLKNSSSWQISWKRPGWKLSQNVQVPVEYLDESVFKGHKCTQNPIATLVVTTKSYQAKDAVQGVLNRLVIDSFSPASTSSRVVLLCNGALSVRDELLPLLGDIPLFLATTTHGAYRETTKIEDPGTSGNVGSFELSRETLVHAGIGKTYIQEGLDDLEKLWDDESLLQTSTLSKIEMEELLWKKLAANCVINPLTALFRCTNGELLMEPSFPELQNELLREISQVAQEALVTTVERTNKVNASDMKLDPESLRQFVRQVIDDTHDNKSSMLQDVVQRKPTEIEHLNGYVVRKGRSLGVECPAHEELVSRVVEVTTTLP